MNENNYNICGRCGSANPLSARYCYQCGFELKNPEAPVVCTKCNTVNPGSANFCKRCGSKLPKAQSKILCPQCSASNNSESTFCVNCGYDFTTHTMPSSVAVRQQIQQQQQLQVAAADAEVIKQPKLSRRERARIKREEEERAYREQIAAKKAAKQQKKELKKAGVQPVSEVVQQQIPQYTRQTETQMFIPAQSISAEKPRKKRFKNLIAFLVALVGIYFILMPQQINFLKIGFPFATATFGGASVPMTGWDIVIACLSNFVSGAASLSDAVAANAGNFNLLEIIFSGILIILVVLALVNYVFAKLVGVCTGKPHKGTDVFAICVAVLTAAGAICLHVAQGLSLSWSWFVFVVPAVFVLLAIFNSNKRRG